MNDIDEKFELVLHGYRVFILAYNLAKELGYDECFCREVAIAGSFHDIGKFNLNENILNKSKKLTQEEFDYIKTHVIESVDIIKSFLKDKDILSAVEQHHENVDGSGYPKGLNKEEIDNRAKIISICDVYDALTSNRTYRHKYSHAKALEEMSKMKNKFDPHLYEAFIKVVMKLHRPFILEA